MTEVHPDVLAQLHRIHRAVNDGTVDKDSVNDALRVLWDLLSGSSDEPAAEPDPEPPEAEAEPDIEVEVAESDPDEGEAPKRKTTKKRHR